MPEEGLLSQFKQLIVGKPIPSHLAHHERLSRFTGLAVLSSDPLSSVAYATEEILRVLILVGVGALSLSSPIAFVIAAILAIVVFSYRQTIHAYPSGGGAYIVAKDNLGETPALIAAGALLIDYVLTVAVSIAAGVAAITSAFPEWHLNRVEMALGFVVVLMLGNLRGIRESGRIFALPTYFFVVSLLALVPAKWWHHLFHNQRALLIKGALLFKPNVVVTSVPFHLKR
jgi:amino acid transporter